MTYIINPNYIYIDQPNFVHVTMYCYIHIIHIFCYYVYSCMYIMSPNRTGVPVSTCSQIRGKRWSDRRNKGRAHVCRISCDTNFDPTLGYPELNNTLYTFPRCTKYTVHGIATLLLNHTISVKIGKNIIFMMLLFIKISYNKILYAILTLS